MKQHVIVKPDLFEVSKTNMDAAKVQALYFLEKRGLEPTKKNLKKYTDNLLKERVEKLKNPNLGREETIVITLKCSISKQVIGYCLIESFKEWESLSILYINKAFRGFGYSQILIENFENKSNKIKVIELDKKDFNYYKGIYKSFDYTLGGVFPTSIALIKKVQMDEVCKAIDDMNNEAKLKQKIRFSKCHEQIINLYKSCKHFTDLQNKMKELAKILKNVAFDQNDFFKYELEHLEKDHPFRDYIDFCLNDECATV